MSTQTEKHVHAEHERMRHNKPDGFKWRNAHRDWRVWGVVVVMVALMVVYVMTSNLSLVPGQPRRASTPEATIP